MSEVIKACRALMENVLVTNIEGTMNSSSKTKSVFVTFTERVRLTSIKIVVEGYEHCLLGVIGTVDELGDVQNAQEIELSVATNDWACMQVSDMEKVYDKLLMALEERPIDVSGLTGVVSFWYDLIPSLQSKWYLRNVSELVEKIK